MSTTTADRSRLRAGVSWFGFGCVMLFLLSPAIVVVISSFTAAGYARFPPDGLSLRWYRELLDNDQFLDAAHLSLTLGLAAAFISTILGSVVAFTISRYRFRGRNMLEALFMAPVAMPGIVLGLGLLQLYSTLNVVPNFWTLLSGHLLITIPFTIRMMYSALATFDSDVERAAQSLGAGYGTVLRTVTLPLLRTGLFGSFIFSFIVSFDEVSVSLFLSGIHYSTLPVELYSFIEESATPLINSVSTVLLFLGVLALLAVEKSIGLRKAFGVDS